MKMFAIMLSLVLSAVSFAATSNQSTAYKKSKLLQAKKTAKTKKSSSKKQVRRKAVPSQKANVAPALSRQLPAKRVFDPEYSSYYPYTESTATAQGSLKLTESREKIDIPTLKDDVKKWYVKFDSENMKNINESNPGGYNGDISAVQTLSYGYKFTDMSTVQISQDWSSAYGYGTTPEGKANAHSNSLEDLNFRYTYSSLYNDKQNNVAGQVRYYAPSSSNSQEAGQIGQIRLYGIWDHTLAPGWTATLLVSPRYFMQTANAYEKQDDSGTISVVNNNQWRLLNSAGIKYDVADWFALETTVGVYSKKKYNEHMKHFQDYSTSFYLNLDPHIGFQIGLRASDGAYDTRDKGGFDFYNPDYSEYFGILTLRI